jgi:hypothetical protein
LVSTSLNIFLLIDNPTFHSACSLPLYNLYNFYNLYNLYNLYNFYNLYIFYNFYTPSPTL